MSSLTLAALTVAAEATPTVITTVNPDGTFRGSPGIVGFGVTFVLAVVIVMLGLDLTRRARRLRYRSEYAIAREAEELAKAETAASAAQVATPEVHPTVKDEAVVAQDHLRRPH
ncbi:hypothetical protein M3668_09745 [Rothia sp. P100]|uniref:hypothetical protein n=1 Tax=Rothia sp. P100 TaxID=2939578 RepID=UPI0020419CCB|nr:hypothetical protein [Rothia sp. P100]